MVKRTLSLSLKQISNIHWHLLNRGIVKRFNIHQRSLVLLSDEINRRTLTTESTTATDTMNVVLTIGRQVVVDDKWNLLYIWMQVLNCSLLYI